MHIHHPNVTRARTHTHTRPVALNTHLELYKTGRMPALPYLFRETCGRSSSMSGSAALGARDEPPDDGLVTLGETLFVAQARRVWVCFHPPSDSVFEKKTVFFGGEPCRCEWCVCVRLCARRMCTAAMRECTCGARAHTYTKQRERENARAHTHTHTHTQTHTHRAR